MFWILAVVIIVFFLATAIRILREYERGVIFRLGRVLKTKGPGLIILIPIIDKMVKVSLRLVAMDVPSQDVITRDNVSVKGECGHILPGHGSQQCGRRGGELSFCHLAAGPDDPEECMRSGGAG